MNKETRLWVSVLVLGAISAGACAVAIWESRENRGLKALLAEYERGDDSIALRQEATPAARPVPVAPRAEQAVCEEAVDTDDSAWNEELARLQALLAHRDQTIAQLRGRVTGLENQPEQRKSREERRREYMEKLKAENPDKYQDELKQREEREARRSEMRERVSNNLQAQISYLSDIDVSALPDDLQANHAKILETLGEFNQAMNTEGERTREERREMFGKMRGLSESFDTERAVLLYDVGMNLGYDDNDAWVFVEHIEQIADMTSLGGIWRRGRRRPDGERRE